MRTFLAVGCLLAAIFALLSPPVTNGEDAVVEIEPLQGKPGGFRPGGDDNDRGGNRPGGNDDDRGGNRPGGNRPGGNDDDRGGNRPGGNRPGGNDDDRGGNRPGGNRPGGNDDDRGGNRPGGNRPGGNPLPPPKSCRAIGERCRGHDACCSSNCNEFTCECRPRGSSCSQRTDSHCCSGSCRFGSCKCSDRFEPCSNDRDCCDNLNCVSSSGRKICISRGGGRGN